MGGDSSDEESNNGNNKVDNNQLSFNGNEERKSLNINLKPEDSENESDEDDPLGNIADELTKEDGSRSKETYSDHDGEPAFLAYMADRAHDITNH